MTQIPKESIVMGQESAGIDKVFHSKREAVDKFDELFRIRTKYVRRHACSMRDITLSPWKSSLKAGHSTP